MNKMDTSKMDIINQYVKAYRTFSKYAVPLSAEILEINLDSIKIESKWSQRNIEREEIVKFRQFHVLRLQSKDIIFESTPVDITSEIMSKTSPTGKYYCSIKELKQDSKKKTYLEIWSINGMVRNFDLSAFDIHGDIYYDGEFGSADWSPEEDKIIYIAEKKEKKAEPFYKQKSMGDTIQKPGINNAEVLLGDEYLYKPDWGEQLVDKHQPVVVVCDLASETLKVLPGIPPNYSPGQVFWSKNGKSIFGVVYENEPRHLGLIYCTNRSSYIFQLDFQGKFCLLSDKKKSVRSPRLNPNGDRLFWLERSIGGAHNGCLELVALDLGTGKKEVLINVVRKGDKKFSGLYLHNLPPRCFSKCGTKLYFSTLNQFQVSSYFVDVESKSIQKLKKEGSSTILDVFENAILIATGSLQKSPALEISLFDGEWFPVTKFEALSKDSLVEEMEFQSSYQSNGFAYYNAIYYGPSPENASKGTVPLLVYPHGGPHSSVYNDYSLEFNFFVSIGFGILAVNYRGSTGVGQDGIDFLRGKLGDTDVKDVHEAVLETLKSHSCLDDANVFLYGKSYGGFLVAQLSAQYSDFYRAVVNCNGVSDVSSMYVTSDIPDWSTAECGLEFNEAEPLSVTDIKKMVEVSPLHLANKIKIPTCFMVGKKDLRVPYSQGISLYNALKARQIKVRLNLYDSNHSLGNVPVHMDYVINSAIWFFEHRAQ